MLCETIEGNTAVSLQVVGEWMSDKWLLLAGFGFAAANTTVAHIFWVFQLHSSNRLQGSQWPTSGSF